MKKVYQLPDDFIQDKSYAPNEIIIRRYKTTNSHVNNQISLNQNMLQLIISGSKSIKYCDEEIMVHSDELFILPHGHILTSDVLTTEKIFESVIIYFSDEVFQSFYSRYLGKIKDKTADSTSFAVLKQDSILRNFSNSLSLLLENESIFSSQIRQVKFEEIFLYLFQKFPKVLESINFQSNEINDEKLVKVVELYTYSKITINDMAFLCHMSLSTFKRKFTALYHTAPQAWILKKRLEKAKLLLTSKGENPSSIFEKVGYESLASFSNAFKKEYGIAPKKFQEQNKL